MTARSKAGRAYAHQLDGMGFDQFAKVAWKNHESFTRNPVARYRREFSLEEVMGAPVMGDPNTLLMCCPTGDGAVAPHLRGEAGDRQVKGAKVGLTHIIGLGSSCAVHILEKAAAWSGV